MWQLYAFLANDLIAEHRREAARAALEREFQEARVRPPVPAARRARPSRLRRAIVRTLRGIEAAADAIAEQACDTASRLERRIA